MSYKYVSLIMGAHENAAVCPLLLQYSGELTLETPESVLRNLAAGIFNKFLKDTKINNVSSPDDFIDYLYDLVRSTADSWGNTEIENWWPWITIIELMNNATAKEVLCISENAAETLLSFLEPEDVPDSYRNVVTFWKNEYQTSILMNHE